MICQTIALYFVVQSVVFASPTPTLLGEPITSPIGITGGGFYHPTPASKARGIPELGKLPRSAATTKKLSSNKLITTAVSSHLPHNGHISGIDTHQPLRSRVHNHADESHHKPRSLNTNDEKAEKINSDLEKMIQFMTVLGQVDRYLSSRAKSFVSTLGRALEGGPDDRHIYNDREIPPYDY